MIAIWKYPPRVDLRGRVIAITGASSGIGRATAVACARQGMHIALLARRADMLESVADAIRSIGVRATTVVGDVTEAGVNQSLLDTAEHELGPVYAVFANAGMGLEEPTTLETLDSFRSLLETNSFSSLDLVTRAIPTMRERGEGHALVCSSCLSKVGVPYYAAYCASKAVQDHAARALRHELAGTGVLVSSVHPVGTKTELFETMRERSGRKKLRVGTPEGILQPPEKVAGAILRRLRKGTGGEVWTSLGMRAGLATVTLFPGLGDAILGKMLQSRLKQSDG